jgi:hypothetical protein
MTSDMEPGECLQFFGYSIAYFDTGIYGMLVTRPESWKRIRAFLMDHNLLLGVSDTNILELSDAGRLHRDLARFLLQVPSAMLQPTNQIIEDEVHTYLNGTTVNPVFGPITSLIFESNDPLGDLVRLLRDKGIRGLRSSMVQQKPAFEKRIHDTRENFEPLVCPDRYTEADGPFYAFGLIFLQILCQDWPACAARIKKELETAPVKDPAILSQFRGLWLSSLAQFYRYYLHCREPSGNDYGDFLHVLPIAYSRLAVVENDLSEDLRHIKRNDAVLQHTEVCNIEFLRQLTGLPLGQ